MNVELEQFPDLESVEAFIVFLEETSAKLDKVKIDGNKINGALAQLVNIESLLPVLPSDLDERLAALAEMSTHLTAVEFTRTGLMVLVSNLCSVEARIADLDTIMAIDVSGRIDGLFEVERWLDVVKRDKLAVEALLIQLKSLDLLIPAALAKIEDLDIELDEKFPNICPLCERVMG